MTSIAQKSIVSVMISIGSIEHWVEFKGAIMSIDEITGDEISALEKHGIIEDVGGMWDDEVRYYIQKDKQITIKVEQFLTKLRADQKTQEREDIEYAIKEHEEQIRQLRAQL